MAEGGGEQIQRLRTANKADLSQQLTQVGVPAAKTYAAAVFYDVRMKWDTLIKVYL